MNEKEGGDVLVLDSVDIVEAVIAGFVILAASTLLAHLLDARERRQADRQRVRRAVGGRGSLGIGKVALKGLRSE